jgi:catechol 2,3-dioxygenase-like lactoylglutathione lyase family enzyme
MIDHVALNVRDLAASKRFFEQALKPLGFTVMLEVESFIGMGSGQAPEFGLVQREPVAGSAHVAFTSPDRKSVDAFYEAALAAGAEDNGPPGVREHYHPTYYAAFVRDREGNNIEAVCHSPG